MLPGSPSAAGADAVLRDVPLHLSESDIAAALAPQIGSVAGIVRFHRTRGQGRRPLPLVRVQCRDESQLAALLGDGAILDGICCPAEPAHTSADSAAALGRQAPTEGHGAPPRGEELSRALHPHGPPKPRVPWQPAAPPDAGDATSTSRPRAGAVGESWPALHLAVQCSDVAAVAQLLADGADVNGVKRQSLTPLMLAAMGGHKEIVELLLAASASAAAMSNARHTAADYARIHGCTTMAQVLQAAQAAEDEADATSVRCPICRERVKRRPGLSYLEERVRGGCDTNDLVHDFFGGPAAQALRAPAWHQLNDLKRLRKEVTETMAVVGVLRRLGGSLGHARGHPLHIVDLCCGKSLTAAVIGDELPHAAVTAVDLLPPHLLPHYAELSPGVHYLRTNVLAPEFPAELARRVEEVARPACILGVHCCGGLSLAAIEAFERIGSIGALLVMPCCLPSQRLPSTPAHLFSSKEPAQQYSAWVELLAEQLRRLEPPPEVQVWDDGRIVSDRRSMVFAAKPGTVLQPGAGRPGGHG